MATWRYHKDRIGNHRLHPETLMLGYGYEPGLSEGAVKAPVFLTSTFVFRNAEEGRDFFDYVVGPPRRRRPATRRGPGLFALQSPNSEIVEDRLADLRGSRDRAWSSPAACRPSPRRCSPIIRPGDVILHSQPLYGGTENLLAQTLRRSA